MKKLLSLLTILVITLNVLGQNPYTPSSKYGDKIARLMIDSAIFIPTGCGKPTSIKSVNLKRASLFYDSCAAKLWLYNPKINLWDTIAGGSGGSAYTLTKNATRDSIILSNGVNTTIVKDSSGGATPNIFQVLTVGDSAKNKRIVFTHPDGDEVIGGNVLSNYGMEASLGYINNGLEYFEQTDVSSKKILFFRFLGGVTTNTILGVDKNSRGLFNFPRDSVDGGENIKRFIPIRVNGNLSDSTGNIVVPFLSGLDSLRNNAGILEGRKNGIFTPQFVLPSGGSSINLTTTGTSGAATLTGTTLNIPNYAGGGGTNIYNTNGTLTGSRRLNGNGYLLKFDSSRLSIIDTSNIDGHLYDYNKGASFVDYNATNVSSLIQNEISGVKFSTNDRNNLDTSNNVWVKPDRVEINSTNRIDINSKTFYPATYTTAGTTGNQTINKNSGSVNIAPATTTLTVTNNLVTANTIVSARVSSNDATAEILNVVSVTNGFIITMATPATAEAQIKFWITN